jgi:hypothetical protein
MSDVTRAPLKLPAASRRERDLCVAQQSSKCKEEKKHGFHVARLLRSTLRGMRFVHREAMRSQCTFRWGVLFGLAATAVLAHGGAVRNGFLYDDFHLIVDNPAVQSHAWREIAGQKFRPVTMITYVVDHAIGGGRPAVYHATQLVWHVLVVGGVLLIGLSIWGRLTPAAAAALLVALHPVQTEAVHYLSARSSILSTFWMLVALWAYLEARKYAGLQRAANIGLGVTAFVLAILSKESGIVFLVWLAAYEAVVERAGWRDAFLRLGPYAAVAGAVWIGQQFVAFGVWGSGASVSVATGFATGVVVMARHLLAWIIPMGIDPVSPQSWVAPASFAAAGATALFATVAIALAWGWRARPLVSWGVVCGLTALFPVMVLPLLTDVALFQPHRGYPASVGFALATVEAVRALGAVAARWVRWRRGLLRSVAPAVAGWVATVALVLGAVWADASQGRVWRDEVRFWSEATLRYSREARYHHSLGAAFLRAGDFARAVDALTTAARLDPMLPRLHYNLGLVYTGMGRLDDALAEYERARERDPTDFKSLANLGWLYEKKGETARALDAYRAALRAAPGLGPVRERVERLDRLGTVAP